jgi:hypothetical protein
VTLREAQCHPGAGRDPGFAAHAAKSSNARAQRRARPSISTTMPAVLSRIAATAALALAAALPAHASCGSAFCSLSTDLGSEATGIADGGLFDLRYEDITQDQPRSGSRKVAVGAIPRDHDEVSTRNRNLIATYTRTFASGWGFSLAAPLVDRRHFHIGNEAAGPVPEHWSFSELGDLRVTGRYQSTLPTAGDSQPVAGVLFGLKLPTGRTRLANAEGELAERTLQPGTGTTDAIVGAYFQQQLPTQDASWFGHVQLQHALNSHADFRPGSQFAADAGYAKVLAQRLTGIVQLNGVVKGRDRGAQADAEDSGGRFLYASPGLSWDVSGAVRAYAFLQQPLWQSVNGVQLTSRRALVLGMATRF